MLRCDRRLSCLPNPTSIQFRAYPNDLTLTNSIRHYPTSHWVPCLWVQESGLWRIQAVVRGSWALWPGGCGPGGHPPEVALFFNPCQALWKTSAGSITSNAVAKNSVRSGWRRFAGPGRALGPLGAGWKHGGMSSVSLALSSSYEYMRRSLIFYRNEIRKMTGKVCSVGWEGHGGLPWPRSQPPCTPRTPWSSSGSPRRPDSS